MKYFLIMALSFFSLAFTMNVPTINPMEFFKNDVPLVMENGAESLFDFVKLLMDYNETRRALALYQQFAHIYKIALNCISDNAIKKEAEEQFKNQFSLYYQRLDDLDHEQHPSLQAEKIKTYFSEKNKEKKGLNPSWILGCLKSDSKPREKVFIPESAWAEKYHTYLEKFYKECKAKAVLLQKHADPMTFFEKIPNVKKNGIVAILEYVKSLVPQDGGYVEMQPALAIYRKIDMLKELTLEYVTDFALKDDVRNGFRSHLGRFNQILMGLVIGENANHLRETKLWLEQKMEDRQAVNPEWIFKLVRKPENARTKLADISEWPDIYTRYMQEMDRFIKQRESILD